MIADTVMGAPLTAKELADFTYRPGGQLFCSVIRRRAKREMERNGFQLAGGSDMPVADAMIADLLEQLDDTQIMSAAMECGALGDGKFLEFITKAIQWIVDHQDQILAVLKIVLSILMMLV
jgi:hypothetical protein